MTALPIWKKWFIAFRPWSFTAAFIPVSLGAVWAWYLGHFNFILFILTLIGGVLIQAGTNLINTYYDYKTGVDTPDSAQNCPVLVAGWIKPVYIKMAGFICFLLAFAIGMYLVTLRGWLLFLLGIIGIAGGYGYTGGIAYKYKGLGSILVFFLMGPLMVWGSFYVQTGFHSWSAILISFPVGFLVSCILHSNDLRDMEHDKAAGIKTFALLTGYRKGFLIHFLLNISAFISVLILTLFNILPLWALISVFFALPGGIKIVKHGKQAFTGNLERIKLLELEAAQFHFQFGSLFTLGILIAIFVGG